MSTATKGQVTLSFQGINQQDFKELQLISGCYPYQIGLQQRIPGKVLLEEVGYPVGSISAFYNVFGNTFLINFYNGNILIDRINWTSIRLPALPPLNTGLLFDDFSGYSPDGLISLLWGGGIWNGAVGVCQTIIQGYFDPYEVYGSITVPPFVENPYILSLSPINTIPNLQPQLGPSGGLTITPTPIGSAAFLYPPGHRPTFTIQMQYGDSNNTCTGSGYEYVEFDDLVYCKDWAGQPVLDTLNVTSIAIGGKTPFHGVNVGRTGNINAGVLVGTCPGPPFPIPAIWEVYADGSFQRVQ